MDEILTVTALAQDNSIQITPPAAEGHVKRV